jgi:preprotein translocase subunit SecA
MLGTIVKKIFGSRNDRTLRRMRKVVQQINELEKSIEALSDDELKNKTVEFRAQLSQGKTLDQILPDAFAVVREVSKRTIGLRHFDVQMIGGMVLHEGNIAEMRTGEGKTLVGTLPAYLNALTGNGVHIVTVNDYLAKRDSEWMKPIYEFLGLTVAVNLPDMSPAEKQQAYQADITFGTNNEFGFDYLRDNMVFELSEKVQRALNFAVVDEVDSILIDEARTPLIISGAAEDSSELYIKVNKIIPDLTQQIEKDGEIEKEGDYLLDEKQRQAHLTEHGHATIEVALQKHGLLEAGDSLYAAKNISLVHHINSALRAHTLFQRDVDYIIQNNEVVIVDEHTGRTMPGRRWSDGLHQAVEAKEKVTIQNENQTLASITFQNYFRIYNKLSGMTGTADTEAYEFQQIYNLDVVVLPTNKPMVRKDDADKVYLYTKDKYLAIIEDIKDCQTREQPVLVGTASIESSELLSSLLNKEKIAHQVLNAKFHEKEAQIVAEAGRPGMVTIATNMAGRGTDIVLGGNLTAEINAKGVEDDAVECEKLEKIWRENHQKVLASGGLRIIGSERHESRRIDNQLRGRAGRQGDPGSSLFYLSFEDNLLRIFGAERMTGLMQKFGMTEGESIEHPIVSRRIEAAQRKVEGHNFDIRKQLLDYDNVANDQRKVIYHQRAEYMADTDLSETILFMRESVIEGLVYEYMPPDSMEEEWNLIDLEQVLANEFAVKLQLSNRLESNTNFDSESVKAEVLQLASEAYKQKEEQAGSETMRHFEKSVLLQSLDNHWREHLAAMDQLRQGIHLRGYAQKDPKQEYKREAFELFTSMLASLRYEVISLLSTVIVQDESDVNAVEEQRRSEMSASMQYQHDAMMMAPPAIDESSMTEMAAGEQSSDTYIRQEKKVGRNDACPCGSGKKYKKCHGQL